MRYDYDFLYMLRSTIIQLRAIAHAGNQIIAHSVIEELAFYLIVEESRFLLESSKPDMECDNSEDYEGWDTWIFEIFDDMDLYEKTVVGGYLLRFFIHNDG